MPNSRSMKPLTMFNSEGMIQMKTLFVVLALMLAQPPNPEPTISAPGSVAKNQKNIWVSASATDTVGVSKVELRVNGKVCNTGTTSATCKVNASTKDVTLTATARDAAGNVGTKTAVISVH
jgi:chitinase